MHYILMLLYWVLLVMAGYAVLGIVGGREARPAAETAGLSVLAGCTIVPMTLFWFSLAGLPASRAALAAVGAAALLAVLGCWRAGRLPRIQWDCRRLDWTDAWILPFGVAIAWSLVVTCKYTFTAPLVDLDAYGIWGLKAKMLYAAPLPQLHEWFHDQSLSYSHPDYPLLVPFLTAGGYAALGEASDTLGKNVQCLLYGGYGLLLYSACVARVPRPLALAVTALGMTAPMAMHWAVLGNADVPLAVFFFAAIVCLLRWMDHDNLCDLLLTGVFCAACVFTKNEGLPLVAILLLVAAVFGARRNLRNWRRLGAVALASFLVLLPWLLFRVSLPSPAEDYFSWLNLSNLRGQLARLPEILGLFFGRMLLYSEWAGLWWAVLAAAQAGLWRRRSREALALGFILIAQLCVYITAYLISAYPLQALLDETADRLLVQALPLGLLLAAASLAEFFPRANGGGSQVSVTVSGASPPN